MNNLKDVTYYFPQKCICEFVCVCVWGGGGGGGGGGGETLYLASE